MKRICHEKIGISSQDNEWKVQSERGGFYPCPDMLHISVARIIA